MNLIVALGNVNRAISILRYWIFDSNYEKALHITKESLDLIFSFTVDEEPVLNIETVYYAVIYLLPIGNIKIV